VQRKRRAWTTSITARYALCASLATVVSSARVAARAASARDAGAFEGDAMARRVVGKAK